jgi:hypothetical protein
MFKISLMYENKCKWCDKIIVVKKQYLFSLHIANCTNNPNRVARNIKTSVLFKGKERTERINLIQICPKCGVEFEQRVTESIIKRNKHKKYCSSECGNSRNWSSEHKLKLSEKCKTSEKVKSANLINIQKLKISGKYRGSGKNNNNDNEFVCLECGKIGYDHNYDKNRKYHKECWLKISGGVRKGSSRGKCGWYNGYWCDSSYELAYLIYCLDNNIVIERNTIGYKYIYNNTLHTYYPDFRVNGELVEIKIYRSNLTDVKLSAVDEKITIYYKDTIKPFLDYAIFKYGKDFINQYQK